MPELPEVEVVRAGLEPAVTGAVVQAVEVFDARSLRRHAGPAEDFVDRLIGARMRRPERRGKFLWIPVDAAASRDEGRSGLPGGAAVLAHLGMSGQLLLRPPDAPLGRLTRIRLDLEHPEHGALRVDFVDQRIFGSMALDPLVPTSVPGEAIPSQVAHIGRDPLDPHFDDDAFVAALRARTTTVKRAMLDQTLVSGIGNIYADEALWAARIHYDEPTRALGPVRARRLLVEVRSVLARALAEGGTSFDTQYVNVNGASGYFSRSLNAYGRQGEPCPRCGRAIVRERFMNRGSHFCASCQKLRAPRPGVR